MKIAKTKPLIQFDEKYSKEVDIMKNYITNLFSNITPFVNWGFQLNNDLRHFIKSVISDFIIYV